jgi:hypothetical protein
MYNLFLGNRPSLLRLAFPLTTIAVMCFAFLPLARAVMPAPDGGYGTNTAEGTNSLFSLTTGVWNTAIGFEALKSDTTGSTNTATGFRALFRNLGGGGNVAVGSQALLNNISGSNNVALGSNSGSNITTGSRNIDIGNGGTSTENNTIRIGQQGTHTDTFIAGIHGHILPDNGTLQSVFINNGGQMGTVLSPPPSSARFKDEIKPMGNVSEAILALKPVTFHYKKDIDLRGRPQFGLVAEEVAKVNPDLVTRDEKGQLYTVRYDAVNAMVLNEFLKEHQKVEQLQATADQQAREIKALSATLKEQAAQIQKVSARVEMGNPAPQVVVNK